MEPNHKFILILLTIIIVVFAGIDPGSSPRAEVRSDQITNTHEIQFHDVKIKRSESNGYKFVGRIQNNSGQNTIRSLKVQIKLLDCPHRLSKKNCILIGERIESIYLTIPPGQERRFKEPIYIYGDLLNLKGDLVWEFDVLSINSDWHTSQ